LKVQTGMTLESKMAEQNSPKNFSRNNYCTCDALKCKKATKSSKMSIYYGNMRPLRVLLRVDIANMDCLDTTKSKG
jgi:hypothetical protein